MNKYDFNRSMFFFNINFKKFSDFDFSLKTAQFIQ